MTDTAVGCGSEPAELCQWHCHYSSTIISGCQYFETVFENLQTALSKSGGDVSSLLPEVLATCHHLQEGSCMWRWWRVITTSKSIGDTSPPAGGFMYVTVVMCSHYFQKYWWHIAACRRVHVCDGGDVSSLLPKVLVTRHHRHMQSCAFHVFSGSFQPQHA